MKRGKCKYIGKLPFKFFNCGQIAHFSSKYPMKNQRIMIMIRNIRIKLNFIKEKRENISRKMAHILKNIVEWWACI